MNMDAHAALPPPTQNEAACPSCNEPIAPGTAFCEACGASVQLAGGHLLTPLPDSATDQPGAPDDKRAHVAHSLPPIAGVTDRGRHHYRNEDAMAFAVHSSGTLIMVVCDGVSSTQVPELASQAAADAALASLHSAVNAGTDLTEALHAATAAAQAAAASVPWHRARSLGAPSCTFVAAIVQGTTVTVGWVGDSRAYVIADNAGQRLSNDHSWAGQAMAEGMTEEEAMADPRAHSITNWLGWDHDHQPAADVAVFELTEPSRVLLCSDGLWNYAGSPGELAALINRAAPADTLALSETLVSYANASGGHDNITVVLTDTIVPPPRPASNEEFA
jgi:PPM family protein phosphatase